MESRVFSVLVLSVFAALSLAMIAFESTVPAPQTGSTLVESLERSLLRNR